MVVTYFVLGHRRDIALWMSARYLLLICTAGSGVAFLILGVSRGSMRSISGYFPSISLNGQALCRWSWYSPSSFSARSILQNDSVTIFRRLSSITIADGVSLRIFDFLDFAGLQIFSTCDIFGMMNSRDANPLLSLIISRCAPSVAVSNTPPSEQGFTHIPFR